MRRISSITILTLSLVASGSGLSAMAASPLSGFTSVHVELPPGDRFFPQGPGSDSINNNCLACHSVEMVLTQPSLPKKVWQAEVEKMRSAYKAPVADEDIQPIVDYLARTKGAD